MITIVSVLVSMLILNVPLTVVTLLMVAIMMTASRKVAGFCGKYFLEQQTNLGMVNGLYRRDDGWPEGCQGLLP